MNLTRQSVRTDAASTYSAPTSSYHGKMSWRRFASRHVPDVAEDLAASPTLAPEIVTRFNGLMRHLKNNSDREEQTKQVMVSQVETLVPEEYDESLRSEFERQCCYGDRENTELMSSSKWMKMLKNCGAVVLLESDKHHLQPGKGAITQAEADVIFLKVLHDCDYGGKKFNYELFCKGLYLVAQSAAPDLDGEQAFAELIYRIVSMAPEDPKRMQDTPDPMLDANVLLVLDHFKPTLLELFSNYCGRNLANSSQGSHGMGTVRISEKTVWRHTTQSLINSTWAHGSTLGLNDTLGQSSRPPNHGALEPPLEESEEAAEEAAAAEDGAAQAPANAEDGEGDTASRTALAVANGDADAGGGGGAAGSSQAAQRRGVQSETLAGPGAFSPPMGGGTCSLSLAAFGRNGTITAMGNTILSSTSRSTRSQEPYAYANGAPVPKDRLRNMSLDQLLLMCRELKIIPELLSKVEIVNIFKKAQLAGSHSNHGSTAYGYLSAEAFIDAIGQLALDAYSKQPYSEEYPEPHERIHAFFTLVIPPSSRMKKNERIAYGHRR